MIVLITSTLFPNNNAFSLYNNEERVLQTKQTVDKLLELDFDAIYIFDNSATKTELTTIDKDLENHPKIHFYHNQQYCFANKGLNEALLILNNIDKLPKQQPIFKISARYYPNKKININSFNDLNSYDFVAKGYNFQQKNGTISTRAYAVKDAYILEQLLQLSIEDMLSYSSKITGIKSYVNSIKNFFNQSIGAHFQISIEHSFARILKSKYKYKLLDKLNIEGYIAGSNQKEMISE